jgi:hypothetical protein
MALGFHYEQHQICVLLLDQKELSEPTHPTGFEQQGKNRCCTLSQILILKQAEQPGCVFKHQQATFNSILAMALLPMLTVVVLGQTLTL